MAIGGNIPPELLRDIVLEACEDAYHGRLLDPFGMTVPNGKEAIKNITACSLTCVYWAQICRQRLFSRVGIKNYEDMCAYASLVSSTPTGLVSISEYARAATLVQRVEERPWLHLVRMQPSLFRFWLLRRVHIRFHIVDSPEDAASSQRSTLHRLFASLPRTLFSSCLQCSSLIIANSRFVAPQDLSTFLQKCQYGTLSLTDVTWDAQTCLESDSLTTDLLSIPSTGSRWGVQAQCSKYSAETAWLAFTTTLRYLPKQLSTVPSLARYGESKPALQVLPSAQRTILDICKSLCQGRKLPFVFFVRYIMPVVETPFVDILPRNTRAYLYYICSMAIREYETARESGKILHEISLAFYKSQVEISGTNVNDSIVVDHISIICAQIKYFRSSIGVRVAFPWEEVVRLCAAQPAFTRLQLLFLSHDQLVQFMETQRAALDMLNGRISIFYNAKTGTRAADYETLADIGDAKEHAYVHSY